MRVYDPTGLPQKDDIHHTHPKVQEIRELSKWSDGHVWVSPEQHGNLVLPLLSSLRPLGSQLTSLCRLEFLSNKLTGFHCQLVQFGQLKDGR